MATKDFRASQIETSKIIGTGSIEGTELGIAIYSGSVTSNREGGVTDANMFQNVGTDVFLFVSGTITNNNNTRKDSTLFGGDVVISGTLYAERQVIEVDSVADGDFMVTGSMFVEPDVNSTTSVAFRNAAGSTIFNVDSTNQRVGIGTTSPGFNLHVKPSSGNARIQLESDDNSADVEMRLDSASSTRNAVVKFYNSATDVGGVGYVASDGIIKVWGSNNLHDDHLCIKSNGNVGIGTADPDTRLEVFSTSTQLKLSNNADDFATFAVGTHGDLTITTVDAAAGNANFEVNADGAVDIDANAGSLSLDGSTGINIGTEADVAIDIDASTLDIDASGAVTIDGTSTVSIGAVEEIDIKSDISVLIMSGGAGTSPLPNGADTNFFVSGSAGSKGSTTKGTSVFGGDLVISGNLHGATTLLKINDDIALTGSARFKEQSAPSAGQNEAVLYAKDVSGVTKLFMKQSDGLEVGPLGSGGALDDAYDTPIGGGTKSPGVGAVITADAVPVQIKVAGANTVGLAVTGSAIFGSGSTGFGSSGLPVIPGSDTHFFVSGSSGGRGSFGTSVFGGDLVSSGTIVKVDSTDGSLVAELTNTGLILPVSKEIQFRSVGQKIFADASSNLFVSASMDLRLFSQEKIILNSADEGEVRYHKGNTEFLRISNSSNDAVIQPRQTDKDIIFKEDGGDEVFRVDSSAKDILMAAGNNVSFGASTRFIGDGSDYNSDATAVVVAGSNDVIIGPGANGQAFMSLGTNGQFVVADGAAPTNYLMITGSSLGGILSSSVHDKNLSIHSNNARESFSITGGGNAIFNDPGPLGVDTVFTVSGSIGSRGTSTRGAAVFGGDLVVSGTMSVNRGQAGAGSAVTVTTEGKVGIGTDNPSYKLEVGGNASFGEFLYHRNNASGQNTYMRFENDKISFAAGNQVLLTLHETGQDIVTVGDGGDVDFQVKTNDDDNTLYVQGSSDRVGIGTNSPVSVLHVKESAPTVSIQRESNSNDSTIAFLGQAGFTGALMHLSKSNDLVFKTHDGSSPHEIMRLGGHFASDIRQVILLSGSDMAASAMQPKESSDINFFVSGAIDSRGTTTRGTSVFGGDVVVSGALRQAGSLYVNNFFMSTGTTDKFITPFRSTNAASDVNTNMDATVLPFSMVPFSGSLEKVQIAHRLGGASVHTVSLFVNGVVQCHMTGASENSGASYGGISTLRKTVLDFTGGTSIVVSGSSADPTLSNNAFNPDDILSIGVHSTAGRDCSITVTMRLNDTVEPAITVN